MAPTVAAGAPDQELLGVHIFSAGKYKVVNPDGTSEWLEYSEGDVKQIADNANKMLASMLHEPPAKLGHDDDQALAKMAGLPAVGWTKRVVARGKDLFADFQQVPAVIAEAIRRGRYKHISSEIYSPEQTKTNFGDAVKGFTLRAVAFLGADVPVVKGMKPLTLNPLMLTERAFCAAEGGIVTLEVQSMDDPTKFAAGGKLMVHANRHPLDALASMKDKEGAKKSVKIHSQNPDDTYNVHEPDSGAVHKNVPHDNLTLLSENFLEDEKMSTEALKLAEKTAEDAKTALLAEQTKTKALQAKITQDRITAFAEKHPAIMKQPPVLAAFKALASMDVAAPVKLAEGKEAIPLLDALMQFSEMIAQRKPVLFGEVIPVTKEGAVEKSAAVKMAEDVFVNSEANPSNRAIKHATVAVAARAAFAESEAAGKKRVPFRTHLLAEAAKFLKYDRNLHQYVEITPEVA